MAFGIDNIFTTYDPKQALEFKLHVRRMMRRAVLDSKGEENWRPLIAHIRSAVRRELAKCQSRIRISDLVQFVTLNVSLMYLFADDVESQQLHKCDERVKFIAKRINSLWMESKGRPSEGLPDWGDQIDMHSAIDYILMIDPEDEELNPMNLILPAYEGMWRAVLRGVLEISKARIGHDPAQWKQTLGVFQSEPTIANWKTGDRDFELSTLDIVKEILRLYPPTRRVKRLYPDEDDFQEADLEKMHRHPRLAGRDPETFRPDRWVQIKKDFAAMTDQSHFNPVSWYGPSHKKLTLKEYEEETLGFMPFARVCPAGKETTQEFGWKMIALLVASVIEGLEGLDGTWTLRAEDARDQLPPVGTALKSRRYDYLSLVFEKDN